MLNGGLEVAAGVGGAAGGDGGRAGHDGGRIVFEGPWPELVVARATLTGKHLAAYVDA